ncbi:hypothetical protein L6468_11385 [Prevotella communis]|uniref:BT4734/BF3469 family protein n=1 Tax=Prevotella communis TaxID=2913614 RepID=UPI001EDA4780|nr:BT4734/BF3469 family protein [Prevotella communis]UKK61580.1 hypothetical protein L6468_11385 [Prevotella communis]UKK64406.1 hypothetical protein L6473_11390 [Prevotella communis]
MFCYQKNFSNPTLPVDEAQFWALVRASKWNENIDKYRETHDAALKRKLPAFIFQATFDETTSKAGKLGQWRKQSATRLTGLVVMDVDHIPSEEFRVKSGEFASADFKQKAAELGILLVYVTPSGEGLKIVFKARLDWGNLIDNQHAMAKVLGVEVDESCKDASRMSFICKESDILFIDKELFTYENKAYGERYDAEYRDGHSQETKTTTNLADGTDNPSNPSNPCSEENNEENLRYHGIEYKEICEAWQTAQGGAPATGDRHRTMLQLALDLRYICDNQPEMVDRVLRMCGFVQDVIRERGDKEVTDIAHTACERKLYKDIPKRMQGVLESVGIHASKPDGAAKSVGAVEVPYEQFAERLEPLLCAPYAEACKGVSRHNWLGAVMASGAMYCTLMTRCWYKHFNGARQRMNPQVLIIGDPASGKSFAKDLDDQIMCAMRAQDEEVRAQETRYKQEQKKRGTSSKAQKQDALVEPEGMIRYLPTKTSNNIFFRRLKRAKEIVDGEVLPMHLYMFDSELDSSISAQSGGAWIGKHDLELKAFHNELSGVDYANGDSINDILPVYWNSVTTGTQISLYKKFTMRNINDGLCSRVAIFQMEVARYQMVKKKMVDWQANEALKQWGFRFEQLHGELPLERLTDHVYELCELSAQEAEAADDHVLDYLRKRAVFYATWLTVPRIIGRQYEQFKKTGQLEINDDDLKFSTLIYDAVIYFQDHFFGQMLQDSWDNAAREYVPRRKNSKNADAYRDLPETFTTREVMDVLDIEENPAAKQCQRWMIHGFVERIKKGKYRKLLKEIMV